METAARKGVGAGEPSRDVPPGAAPIRFAKAYHAELEALGRVGRSGADPGWDRAVAEAERAIAAAEREAAPPPGREEEPAFRGHWESWDAATSALYAAASKAARPLSALCLSGGGIRSAAFNLGVLQALSARRLLAAFDYLSSVSGGGYVAGWLHAWAARWGREADARELVARLGRVPRVDGRAKREPPRSPHAPEPRTVEHLREYGNYLTPRLGLFAGDTWSLVALVLRNVLLNWLVFLPILAGVMGLPVLAMYLFDMERRPSASTVGAALALEALAAAVAFLLQRRSGSPSGGRAAWIQRLLPPASAVLLGAAAVLLAWAAPSVELASLFPKGGDHLVPLAPEMLLVVGGWTIGAPLAGWLVAWIADGVRAALRPSPAPPRRAWTDAFGPAREVLALVLAGALAGGALLLPLAGWNALLPEWAWLQWHHAASFAAIAPPLLVLSLLLARSLFIALAGLRGGGAGAAGSLARGEGGREWWARHSGLLLGGCGLWGSLFVVAGGGEWLLGDPLSSVSAAGTWLVAGGGASLAAMSDRIPFVRRLEESAGELARRLAIVAAATAGLVALLAALAAANIAAAGAICRALLEPGACPQGHPAPGDAIATVHGALLGAELGLSAVLLGIGWLFGFAVDVNHCSLQGLYRNRLVRAFLGASRGSLRNEDRFTGFDPADDRPLASLRDGASVDDPRPRPMPIFNATLNMVAGKKLAWQERKGESFTMTPLHCGNFHDGYRPTGEWAGPGGISLGTAMAISGAAASPNMGYFSSPLVTFVMALFNARLGAWLPNTGAYGAHVLRAPGPRNAAVALLRELLGLTHNRGWFVNLSDGGHFENLGIYEAVLRRCRLVVASDAAADGGDGFTHLGNAIRKIRIDLGIRIDFAAGLGIAARGPGGDGFGLAWIHYDDVDGEEAAPGVLIYLKPTIALRDRAIPADVAAYAMRSDAFPNEPLLDQWFSESQFESYRRLGEFLAGAAIEELHGVKAGEPYVTSPGALAARARERLVRLRG